MPLDDSIIASVANSNFKTMSELGVQNALGHQQRLQILAEKALAKSLENMDQLSVSEGLGEATAMRSDVAGAIAALAGAIGSAQISTKGAQTTPPVTAP